MSAQISSKGVCGIEGATCPKKGSPNNLLCCSYLEYIVNASCSGLNHDQISGIAQSKFSECSTRSDCVSPPVFQLSRAHTSSQSKQPQSMHMAATAVVRHYMYMLGGFSGKGDFLDSFWRLDTSQYPLTWVDMSSLRGAPTGGRRGAAMASVQAIIVMVGGEGAEYLFEDVFLFDTDTAVWTDVTFSAEGDKPSARYLHAMVGAGGSKAYLFGGETISGKASDLYGEALQEHVWLCPRVCVVL